MEKELLEFQKNAILGKIAQPLCNDYKAAWRACGDNKEMLVRLALSQQATPYLSHACYKNLGLSKKYILENFGDYINGRRTFNNVDGVQGYSYELFVDYGEDMVAKTDVVAMMWCHNNVLIPQTKCPTLYISNISDVHISCDGYNSIRIYLFDESNVVIDESSEDCEVIVYKYSNTASVEMGKFCFARVKIFNKTLRL